MALEVAGDVSIEEIRSVAIEKRRAYAQLHELVGTLTEGRLVLLIILVSAVIRIPEMSGATSTMMVRDQCFASTLRMNAGRLDANTIETPRLTAAHTSELGRSVPLFQP